MLSKRTRSTRPSHHHQRASTAINKGFGTETAVLKVVSDVLQAADRGQVTLLGMLDLSAAFDTVDHEILIDRLRQSFGIRGLVLSWIESFL